VASDVAAEPDRGLQQRRVRLSESGEFPAGTGVVPLEQVRTLSGLEFLGAIAAGRLPAPPISAVLGFRLVEVVHGRAVFGGQPQSAF